MPTTYAIPDGRVAMAATLYTGTGANRSVSNAVNGVGFQPDWVWMKARSAANSHYLANSVMGVGFGLLSDATNAQVTVAAGKDLTSFDAAGFSLGPEQSFGSSNTNGTSIVAWQWKAGGTAVSNTAGSITSSVSANTTAGFSVVTYTGTGANATVGHGLGVAPKMIILWPRNNAGYVQPVWHTSLGGSTDSDYLAISSSGARNYAGPLTGLWNNTAPTSSVFSIGTSVYSNTSAINYVAYCFAPVAGYSAMGGYVGNGSTDGPFLYLGFRARFVLFKITSGAGDWYIYDTSRDTYNVSNTILYPNGSYAENQNAVFNIDMLSNGIKIRNTSGANNTSGATYIYYAVAENPFAYSNAR